MTRATLPPLLPGAMRVDGASGLKKRTPSSKGQITPTERGRLNDSTRVINLCHMSTTVSNRLCEDLAYWVENQAKVTGRSQSSLVKEALGRLRQPESEPNFMSLADAVDGPPGLSHRKGLLLGNRFSKPIVLSPPLGPGWRGFGFIIIGAVAVDTWKNRRAVNGGRFGA